MKALTANPDRADFPVLAAVLAITVLAWLHISGFASAMTPATLAATTAMSGMHMGGSATQALALAPWSLEHASLLYRMWAVMMIGMMTPAVTPMVLAYARRVRSDANGRALNAPAAWFLAGYLLAWCMYSLVATLGQMSVEMLQLFTPLLSVSNREYGGALLTIAGVSQLTPLKHACLKYCRAPQLFIQQHGGARRSATGALRLGCLHGCYCIGCCWGLMAVLFFFGIMNLIWIAALTALVLLERLLPFGHRLAQTVGSIALAAGLWFIAASL